MGSRSDHVGIRFTSKRDAVAVTIGRRIGRRRVGASRRRAGPRPGPPPVAAGNPPPPPPAPAGRRSNFRHGQRRNSTVPDRGSRVRSRRSSRPVGLARSDPGLRLGLRHRPRVPPGSVRALAHEVRLARRKIASTAGRTSSPRSTASRSTSSTRSDDPDALPLIMSHGWPGSVAEFLDVIEPLRETSTWSCRRCPATAGRARRPSRDGTCSASPTRGHAHGAPRLRPLRRAGRRLGRDDLGVSRGHRRRPRDRAAQQHAVGVPRRRERDHAHRGRDRRSHRGRRVHEDRRRVPGDPGQEPADARLRPHRFAGRPRGMDRREVPRLDRQQRQPGRRGHAIRSSRTSPSTG